MWFAFPFYLLFLVAVFDYGYLKCLWTVFYKVRVYQPLRGQTCIAILFITIIYETISQPAIFVIVTGLAELSFF